MILGRGTAPTDAAIIAEYRAFLASSSGIATDRVRNRVGVAAGTVCKRMGKPITAWTEQEMLALFAGRCKMVAYGYAAFLGFLIFRGYVQVRQIAFYDAFPLGLCRLHRPALQPIRERLERTRKELRYAAESRRRGLLRLERPGRHWRGERQRPRPPGERPRGYEHTAEFGAVIQALRAAG